MENKTTKIRVYTTQDLCKIVGISEPRVHQLRNGQKLNRKNKKGIVKTYVIEPILVENEDWEWLNSEVVFFPSAIHKAINRNKRPDLMTRTPSETPDSTGVEVQVKETK